MAKTARYSSCTVINGVVKSLVKAGWQLVRSNRHPRIKSPDGKITITVPSSPSDRRASQNWMSQIKREGVEIPT